MSPSRPLHPGWTSTAAGLLLLTAACRVASLPPSSSRSDGGPVFARGVISHEARSQLRLYRDAAGCESIQTTNRQFRVVTVTDATGSRRIVLEETYDVRLCTESESVGSEALITAWRPDSGQTAPLFQISGRGVSGTPVGNLYRMTSRGCCGSQELSTYYSLLNGRALFASSLGLRELALAGGRQRWFLGVHDTYSASAPPEAAHDSSVVAVLEMGNDREPAQRVTILFDRPEPFAASELAFSRGGVILPDTALALTGDSLPRGLAVRVGLAAPESSRKISVTVPIIAGRLAPDRARLPAGVRLRADR